MPTPKARDSQPEGYEAGLRRSQPQVGTIAKAIADGDQRFLLPTTSTIDGKPVDVANQVATRNSLQLQSITAILGMPESTWQKTDLSGNKDRQNGEGKKRRDKVVNELPTPTTQDAKNTAGPSQYNRNSKPLNVEAVLMAEPGEVLPTTTASDWKGANHSGSGSASSRGISTVVEQTNWGKFEPAIKRWETVLGRPAPEPTKPDGKENAHRLSSRFTEWMMGVPEGWITDVGLSRNDELKACGNGVVPQQAELALRMLLSDD